MVRDPVTGELVTYAEMSIRLQQRRRAAQAAAPRLPEGTSIVARNTANKGAPVKGNIEQGWVEKNKGGIIDMNDPTNRDTVPAMLTPGEFVLNKEATQMYGPIVEQMNNHGLQQRHMENQQLNIGGKVKKLYNEGYTAPGQAYAVAKSMGYNTGGLVDFLKKHEGWRDEAYDDGYGTWTIGYGRTTNADGSPIKPGQTTTREAEDAWIQDRAAAERTAIDNYADKHGYDWSEKERDALASFRYNGGQGMIDQLTDNGTRDMDTIKSKFGLYNKSGGQHSEGLQNRRNYEMELAGWGNVQPVQGTNMTDYIETPHEVPPVNTPIPKTDNVVEAPTLFGLDQQTLGILTQGLLSGGASVGPMPAPQVGGQQPIKSAQEIRAMTQAPRQPQLQGYNFGGWVKNLFGGDSQPNNVYSGWDNVTQEQALQQAQTFNNPGASNINTHMPGLEIPKPMSQPNVNATPDTLSRPGIAEHVGNRFNMESPTVEEIPEITTLPPVPGSDEAILQGSSQQVENDEERLAANKRIRDFAKTYPEGHPIRARLMNDISHIKGIMPDTTRLNNIMSQSPGTGTDNFGVVGGQGVGADIGSVNTSVDGVPTPVGLDTDEQYRLKQELQQNRLNQAVTAADNTDGLNFLQQQEKSIIDALTGAPAQPGYEGGSVPLPTAPGMVDDPMNPNAQGYIPMPEGFRDDLPTVDTAAPEPQLNESPQAQAEAKEPEVKVNKDTAPQIKSAVEKKLVDNGETATADEAAAAESAGRNAPQDKIDKAKSILQENFGGLFDKKELARAAVLFAGAMLTGASPQKSLAIAGQHYMGRLDAKEAAVIKSQEQAAAAAAKRQPTIDMTQKDQFIITGKNGKPQKIQAYKMTTYGPNGEKIHSWVDAKTRQPIDADAHQNFDTVPGTSEYNDRVQTESATYADTFKELQNRFGLSKGRDGENIYATDMTPQKVGLDASKWGIKHNVPPEAMGQLIENAYTAAMNDSKDGQKARHIEPYLNDQYIQMRTGSADLFKGADVDKTTMLMDRLEQESQKSSTEIVQFGQAKWAELPEHQRQNYVKSAGSGTTPFMLFLDDIVNGVI